MGVLGDGVGVTCVNSGMVFTVEKGSKVVRKWWEHCSLSGYLKKQRRSVAGHVGACVLTSQNCLRTVVHILSISHRRYSRSSSKWSNCRRSVSVQAFSGVSWWMTVTQHCSFINDCARHRATGQFINELTKPQASEISNVIAKSYVLFAWKPNNAKVWQN